MKKVMKKILVSLFLCLFGLTGFAQSKGDMSAGVHIGIAPIAEKGAKFTNFGIGALYRYNITNPIRLEADLEYWFKNKGVSVFDITANVHYLFHFDKLCLYPLAGIGYGSANSSYSVTIPDSEGKPVTMKDSNSAGRFIFNLGAGAEYPITEKITAGLEIKYQYMKDFSRWPITIGATYHF